MSLRTCKPVDLSKTKFVKNTFLHNGQTVFTHNFGHDPGKCIAASGIIMKNFSDIFFQLRLSKPVLLPVFFQSGKPYIITAFRGTGLHGKKIIYGNIFQGFIIFIRKIFSHIIQKFILQMKFSLIHRKSNTDTCSDL